MNFHCVCMHYHFNDYTSIKRNQPPHDQNCVFCVKKTHQCTYKLAGVTMQHFVSFIVRRAMTMKLVCILHGGTGLASKLHFSTGIVTPEIRKRYPRGDTDVNVCHRFHFHPYYCCEHHAAEYMFHSIHIYFHFILGMQYAYGCTLLFV